MNGIGFCSWISVVDMELEMPRKKKRANRRRVRRWVSIGCLYYWLITFRDYMLLVEEIELFFWETLVANPRIDKRRVEYNYYSVVECLVILYLSYFILFLIKSLLFEVFILFFKGLLELPVAVFLIKSLSCFKWDITWNRSVEMLENVLSQFFFILVSEKLQF